MLGLLGDEWTLLIIQRALLGATRYGEFATALPVSHSVLTGRLQSLTAHELLARREYQTNPARSEYLVTARSRSLWPMLTSIWEWERAWVADHTEQLPGMRHERCGSDFAPQVTCRACGAVTSEKDLVVQWGPSGSWRRSVPSTTNRRRSGGRRTGAGLLFPQTMSVIGDRWAFALLVAAFVGVTRFTDFQSQLGAPPATIADRLSGVHRRTESSSVRTAVPADREGPGVLPGAGDGAALGAAVVPGRRRARGDPDAHRVRPWVHPRSGLQRVRGAVARCPGDSGIAATVSFKTTPARRRRPPLRRRIESAGRSRIGLTSRSPRRLGGSGVAAPPDQRLKLSECYSGTLLLRVLISRVHSDLAARRGGGL